MVGASRTPDTPDTPDEPEGGSHRGPIRILVGGPRFSVDHRWSELVEHFPASRQDVTIEVVECGGLEAAIAAGSRPHVIVPRMSAVTASIIERSGVRLVHQFGVGIERVDLAAARRAGVLVANMPGLNAGPTAERAIALLLALGHRLPEARSGFRPGHWGEPTGRTLTEATVCVVGLGAVGTAVVARLRAFGPTLIGVRRRRDPDADIEVVGVEDLHGALSRADAVVVTASQLPGAGPVVDAAAIAAMRPGAILVNVARGSVIDNDAALAALEAGRLAGLGLDVFPQEPYPADGDLLAHPQVVATAHSASMTTSYFRRAASVLGRAVDSWASGRPPAHLLT